MQVKYNSFCSTFLCVSRIFICLCLILPIARSAEARLKASPAGGGWLQLDDEHDFVSTAKQWFPEEHFEELTAEAWIYLEEFPAPETHSSIIGQEGRFHLVITGFLQSLGVAIHAEGAQCSAIAGVRMVLIEEWVHVAAFCNAGAGYGLDGFGAIPGDTGGYLLESDKPLRIGGIVPGSGFIEEDWGNELFRGCIDEVRISSVLRYPPLGFPFFYEAPEDRFEVDEHTLSLWHFDEGFESPRYEDSSGNGYHLWRSEIYAVQAQDKLSTTWGRLKQ